jgi:hypothetical protein
MKAVRKLVLGETWALPIGVALTLVAGIAGQALAGDEAWWRHAGGFVLLVLAIGALWSALPRRGS